MSSAHVVDTKRVAKQNDYFRRVLFTTDRTQLVVMSLEPGEAIGMEMHDGDQVLYIVAGDGLAVVDDAEYEIGKGSVVFVPAGVMHNVTSGEDEPLKLFTVYAPPQHAAGAVQRRKGDGDEAKDEPQADAELATIDAI